MRLIIDVPVHGVQTFDTSNAASEASDEDALLQIQLQRERERLRKEPQQQTASKDRFLAKAKEQRERLLNDAVAQSQRLRHMERQLAKARREAEVSKAETSATVAMRRIWRSSHLLVMLVPGVSHIHCGHFSCSGSCARPDARRLFCFLACPKHSQSRAFML
mmetsp:Transcript_9629/g.36131  ORF Transcript_9629/g.36131 Transcript_9629/m.36131 type:complete len:162 (+) Transcript_9629:2191-2676(+)